jgi:hypothetical protein
MVLVDNVQLVNIRQDEPLPTLVWFDSLDSFYRFLPQSLYYSTTLGFVFRGAGKFELGMSSILGNREIDIRKWSTTSGKDGNQVIGDMVESADEVMCSVPDHPRNIDRDRFNVAEAIDALTAFRIVLERDRIGVYFECTPKDLKVVDVIFGSFDL